MTKTIIISGATGNLGKEVVNTLKENKFQFSLAVDAQNADWFASMPATRSEVVELLDEKAAEIFVKNTLNEYGGIDAGIFLAGGFAEGNILDSSDADILRMLDLNFLTAFHLVKPMLRIFQKQAVGQFIFVGARPALIPSIGKEYFAYALSKRLLFELADMINADTSFPDITAAVVVPSTMDTPGTRASMPEADFSKWVSTKHVAENIHFLLSDAGRNLREAVFKIYNQS